MTGVPDRYFADGDLQSVIESAMKPAKTGNRWASNEAMQRPGFGGR